MHDKLASHLDKMPAGVRCRRWSKVKGIDDVPVVTLTCGRPSSTAAACAASA